MAPFDGEYQNLQKTPTIFCALALTVSDTKIKNVDLQKTGYAHEEQFSQLHHSMANVKIYSCFPHIVFALALPVNVILTFEIFKLEKLGQGHGLQVSQWRHSMANVKIYKNHMQHFCADCHR